MLSGKLLGQEALSGEVGVEVLRTGGGGTTNYNNLVNKPSINGVTLQGNKTTEELGIVSEESDPTVPQYVKDITSEEINDWNKINTVESIAKGAQQAKSFMDYATLVEIFNGLSADVYKSGQIFNIATTKVPDLWVYGVAEENVPFTYTSDTDIVNLLDTNGTFQVGYYIFGAMETGKVDLEDYMKKTDIIATQNPEDGSYSLTFKLGE